jgi:ribosome-associated protein
VIELSHQTGGETLEGIEIAREAVNAASDKLADDIILLDTRGENRFAEFFVICSAETDRQIQAISQEIVGKLRQHGVKAHHEEGTSDSGWILLDYGNVIVNIFSQSEREFYQLDRLWEDAATLVHIQ